MSLEDALIKNLFGKKSVRPTLGDRVDLSVLRARLMLQEISPGMNDLRFFAGKKYGEAYVKHLGDRGDLKKGMAAYFEYVKKTNFGIPELVSYNEKKAMVRIRESAVSYGLSNVGINVCSFDSGLISGFLSAYTGKHMIAREVKCSANGSEYCEFLITPAKFEEKFMEALKF